MMSSSIIFAPVGNNLKNDPEDVLRVKTTLGSLGRFDQKQDKNGYITRDLDSAVKGYQRDKNLKIDGIIYPGGETEQSLQQDLVVRRRQQENSLRQIVSRIYSSADEEDPPSSETPPEEEPPAEKPPKGKDPHDDNPGDSDDPPVPPRKPEPPEDQESDCSHHETVYELAKAELEVKKRALDAAEESLQSLKKEKSIIREFLNDESSQNKAARIGGGIAGSAVGGGVGFIVGGLPGMVAGVGAGLPSEGSISAGIEGIDDVLKGRTRSELKKKLLEIQKMIQGLEQHINETLKPAVNEAQKIVDEAASALNHCLLEGNR